MQGAYYKVNNLEGFVEKTLSIMGNPRSLFRPKIDIVYVDGELHDITSGKDAAACQRRYEGTFLLKTAINGNYQDSRQLVEYTEQLSHDYDVTRLQKSEYRLQQLETLERLFAPHKLIKTEKQIEEKRLILNFPAQEIHKPVIRRSSRSRAKWWFEQMRKAAE